MDHEFLNHRPLIVPESPTPDNTMSAPPSLGMGLAVVCALVLSGVLLRDSLSVSQDRGSTLLGWGLYVIVLAAYVAAGSRSVQNWLKNWCQHDLVRTCAMGGAFCCLLVPLHAMEGPGFNWMSALESIIYLLGVVVLAWSAYGFARRTDDRAVWADLVVLCFLWVPVALHFVPNAMIPPYMEPAGPHHSMVGPAPAVLLLAIPLTLMAFTVIRPVPLFEFSFDLSLSDLMTALVGYATFVLVFGLPIGLKTGLAHLDVATWPPPEVVGTASSLFFFPAILEEFFFRGVLLNLLASRLTGPRRRWVAMVLCALLFGAVHPPRPPGYRLVAALAGLCYGIGYLRTGKLAVPIIMHTLVDFTWVYLFAP